MDETLEYIIRASYRDQAAKLAQEKSGNGMTRSDARRAAELCRDIGRDVALPPTLVLALLDEALHDRDAQPLLDAATTRGQSRQRDQAGRIQGLRAQGARARA